MNFFKNLKNNFKNGYFVSILIQFAKNTQLNIILFLQ